MELRTTELGTTGMQITRVGFGSWALGGGDWASSWGPQDDVDSVRTVRHAVDAGVNWIDTAAVYGLGHSEEIVARALKDYASADRPFVFTKGGLAWDPDDRRAGSRKIGDAATLRRQVDESLSRLGVDRIDLYFMHWPPADGTPIEEYWATLVDLRTSGKLRAIGLSNHGPEELSRAEHIGHVDVIQPPFSAIDPTAAEAVLPWCVEHRTGSVVYSPMGSGLLTGRFSRARVDSLPEDDWRRRSSAFTTHLDANLATAAAVREVAERHATTSAAVAVAWTLGFAGVSAAIVGARTPAQVDDWLAAADLALTDQDYARISDRRPL